MVKSDKWIRAQKGMIEPFVSEANREGVSYGVSSAGYDIRVANEFQLFTNLACGIVDPKAFEPSNVVKGSTDQLLMPPGSFALARSVETLRIPNNIMGICVGKSTYARCGIITPLTPLEPGWEGQVTLEISNTSGLPAIIYANEGICQVLFLEIDGVPTPYAGSYQNQEGITAARVFADSL